MIPHLFFGRRGLFFPTYLVDGKLIAREKRKRPPTAPSSEVRKKQTKPIPNSSIIKGSAITQAISDKLKPLLPIPKTRGEPITMATACVVASF